VCWMKCEVTSIGRVYSVEIQARRATNRLTGVRAYHLAKSAISRRRLQWGGLALVNYRGNV